MVPSDIDFVSTTQVYSQENNNFRSITIITGATVTTVIVVLIITLFVVTAVSIKGRKCRHKDNSSTAANNEAHEMTPQNTIVDANDPTYDYPVTFDIKENVAYATITERVIL